MKREESLEQSFARLQDIVNTLKSKTTEESSDIDLVSYTVDLLDSILLYVYTQDYAFVGSCLNEYYDNFKKWIKKYCIDKTKAAEEIRYLSNFYHGK